MTATANRRIGIETQKRLLALALGLVTIGAALFAWRAGQIGSTAAYYDRQSIGQTISQEEENVEVALAGALDAVSYVRYVADYAEAGTLSADASALNSAGARDLAEVRTEQAVELRRGATVRAATQGVFGAPAVFADILEPQPEALAFDLPAHLAALRAEISTGIQSPGDLDPEQWAQAAESIRVRMRGLRVAVLVMIVAGAALTVAQVAVRQWTRTGFAAFGVVTGATTAAATVMAVW